MNLVVVLLPRIPQLDWTRFCRVLSCGDQDFIYLLSLGVFWGPLRGGCGFPWGSQEFFST